jgi:hypothetical protein
VPYHVEFVRIERDNSMAARGFDAADHDFVGLFAGGRDSDRFGSEVSKWRQRVGAHEGAHVVPFLVRQRFHDPGNDFLSCRELCLAGSVDVDHLWGS